MRACSARLILLLGGIAAGLLAPASAATYTICLAAVRASGHGPVTTDCAMLTQVLQGSNINWQHPSCSSSPPTPTGAPNSSSPLFFTCMNFTALPAYSRMLCNLWFATQPVIKAQLRSALTQTYTSGAVTGGAAMLWGYFSYNASNIPVGSTAAVRAWYLLYSPEAQGLSPPPPIATGGTPPPQPPPPSPPPGVPSDERCKASGGGYLLLVDSLELCIHPPPPTAGAGQAPCYANFTVTNVGTTSVPATGIRTTLKIWLEDFTYAGLPEGDSKDAFLFQTNASTGTIGFMYISHTGTRTPPNRTFSLSLPISCPQPPAYQPPQKITLPSGSYIETDASCPASAISAAADPAGLQCFSLPERVAPAVAASGSLDTQLNDAGICTGTVVYSVTNLGNSTVSSIQGPLTVNLEAAGLQAGPVSQVVNATVVQGGINASYLQIADFGSEMDPGASSTFQLPVWCPGSCPCDNSMYIEFGTSSPPVCTVDSVSTIVDGESMDSSSPDDAYVLFDDGCCVDPQNSIVQPAIIMADYRDAGGIPSSYLYTTYWGSASGLPSMRGWLSWSAYASILAWNPVHDYADYTTAVTNRSITLVDQGIVRLTVYSYNGVICGLDGEAYWLDDIFAGQLDSPPCANVSVGCTPSNHYPPADAPGPYNSAVLVAPNQTYLGWFSGFESQAYAVASLQAVWLTCSG